jgi:hypothetical protein
MYLTKVTKLHCSAKYIIDDSLSTIKENIKIIEDKTQIIAPFKPSKTSLNAINFLSRENIQELRNSQEPIVLNMFRILNVIDNRYDNSENIVNNFFHIYNQLSKINLT